MLLRGGNSQLILDSSGPLPLSILGTVETGAAFSFSLRSCRAGGFILLGVSLESGTSSLFFVGVFSGNLADEIGFLVFLVWAAGDLTF